ncbi:sugar-binding domain-containing protein [Maribellus sediminis]|uniref:sugar-binding domain-containing protein n=1 Tax=Maribellus sediminis TaxID=2696285 RepID=UPI0014321F92|nr:sugar-binding domain-containing protein [Maribellus sediminis]
MKKFIARFRLIRTGLLLTIAIVAISCSKPEQSELDLSGVWNFSMDEQDAGVNDKWFAKDLSDTIVLPGSMTSNAKGNPVGYDTKFTGNSWKEYADGKSWYDDPNYKPYLSDDEFLYPFWLIADYYYTGAAWYQKEIEIPENWEGQDVELYLERCHWETRVWVNNDYVGMNNALGVPHRYNIGSELQPGKNRITICVDNRVKEIKVGDDAHSVSDNTQSNWNGIVGDIKLIRKDDLSVADVQIFPDVKNKSIRVEIGIKNETGGAQTGKLKLSAKSTSVDSPQKLSKKSTEFELNSTSKTITVIYPMGDDVRLWDEFNPNLYELTVELNSGSYKDEHIETFGMRDFRTEGKSFVINDRPVFLRGTLECAIFPKTGFPPTEVKPWERIIKICKAHGLNHIRFHSWCPPKAAFEAADKLGFYYQVEVSAWATIGDGAPIDKWIYDESERMVAEYGNHPSFCMMPYGNEPSGKNHREYLTDFVKFWKAKDTRRVYTTAAGWPIIPESDYHNVHSGTRIQGWNQNLNSIINSQAPRSDYDWEKTVAKLTAPMVSHEIGQWCVYPNFKEIPKYDGVLKATNFKIFKRSLEAHGMLDLADSFLKASGKLQALCYKADIEAALRTKGFGGFQLLDLHDFPGQGTALVGVLDPFWDEKGYISPEEFSQFCNETVPLARFKKMIFTSDEKVECEIEVAHYGEKELQSVVPSWQIVDAKGDVVKKGQLTETNISWGNCQKLGSISENINVESAAKYQLQLTIAGFINTWDFWVYPTELPKIEDDILVVSSLNKAAIATLEKGGKVLLTTKKGSIKEGKGGEVAVGFSSIFWNTAWTNGQQPHTLGILCNPEHPALADFPTEYHSNWQWWDAMSHSNAISLEDFEIKPEPIVRIIDDWVTNRNLALIFEAKVGKGKLVMAGVDLQSDLETRPEARQLLYSLKSYMSGEKFDPQTELPLNEIESLFLK